MYSVYMPQYYKHSTPQSALAIRSTLQALHPYAALCERSSITQRPTKAQALHSALQTLQHNAAPYKRSNIHFLPC